MIGCHKVSSLGAAKKRQGGGGGGSNITQGYLLVARVQNTSAAINHFDPDPVNNPDYEAWWSQTINDAIYNIKRCPNGPLACDTGILTGEIPWFNKDLTYEVHAAIAATDSDTASFTLEFCDAADNPIWTLEATEHSNYKMRVRTRVGTGTYSAYKPSTATTVVNLIGRLTFTDTSVQYTSTQTASHVLSFSDAITGGNSIAKVKISNARAYTTWTQYANTTAYLRVRNDV